MELLSDLQKVQVSTRAELDSILYELEATPRGIYFGPSRLHPTWTYVLNCREARETKHLQDVYVPFGKDALMKDPQASGVSTWWFSTWRNSKGDF